MQVEIQSELRFPPWDWRVVLVYRCSHLGWQFGFLVGCRNIEVTFTAAVDYPGFVAWRKES